MIVSEPGEYYDGTLDFVSLESGLIVNRLNLEGIYDMDSIHIEYHDTVISEPINFYDLCTKQRYDVGDNDFCSLKYKNEECTEFMERGIITDDYRVLSCKRGPIHDDGRWTKEDQEEYGHLYSWEYTVAKVLRKEEIVYHPEEDEFLQRTKKVFDIEIPEPRQRNVEQIGYEIAKLMNYEIVNVLKY